MNFERTLNEPIKNMSSAFLTITTQLQELQSLQASLNRFNLTFGSFLTALKLQSEAMEFTTPAEPVHQPTATTKNSKAASLKPKEESVEVLLRRVMEGLPPKYQEPFHKNGVESTIRFLFGQTDPVYAQDIIVGTMIVKVRSMEYINLLVKNGVVLKTTNKGFVYQLNKNM